MKKILCATAVGLVVGFLLFSQNLSAEHGGNTQALSNHSQHANDKGCRTDDVLKRVKRKSTRQQIRAMEDAKAQLASETQLVLADMALARQAGVAGAPMEITIPVVVHVVHDWGPEYIGEAQIIDAIDQMTEDFHAWPYAGSVDGFGHLQTNVGFTFKLAQIDPWGNPTNGITYTQSTTTYDGTEGPLQSTINWPREKYLNIWCVNSSDGTGSGSAYSNYPSTVADGTGNEFWDGIVCSYWAFGRTGTAISTHYKILTHEAGHWANLIHTWGQVYNNGDPNACYDDDEVADTPNTSGNTGCTSNYTCGSWDNTENFMDYGRCTTMYTPGQSDRMQAAMRSSVARRNNLWTDANLIATGLMTGNLPPVAEANGPYYGNPGVAVNFSSAGSNEPNGVITSYQWAFGDGVTSTLADPTHTYAVAGTYTVSLTVTDDDGQTATTSTTATIIEAGTFISAETEPNDMVSQANGPAGPMPEVDGSISTTADQDWFFFDVTGPGTVNLRMDILGAYADLDFWIYHESDMNNWIVEAYTDDPSAPYEVGEFNATGAGRYFILVDGWETETSDYRLKLTGANIGTISTGQPPVANPNGPYNNTVGSLINFTSAGSTDPDGTIVSYAWDFGDGATSTAANPTHSYAVAGNYTITLTVTDDQGMTGSARTTADIIDNSGNLPPVAVTNGPYSGTEGIAVSFSSAGSSDPDGTIASYSWRFGDGTTSTAANPTHVYSAAGTYTVMLTVTDNLGLRGSTTTTVSITGGAATEIEPNDDSADASGPVAFGTALGGTLSSASDVDWFYFDVASPRTVNVSFNMADSGQVSWVAFHEANMGSYVGWPGSGMSGTIDATVPGRYYIQLYSWGGYGARPYTLTIQ